MVIVINHGLQRRRRKRKSLYRHVNSTIHHNTRHSKFQKTEKKGRHLYQLPPSSKRPNLNVSKDLYRTAVIEGEQLDWTSDYARGGFAIGHVGPGNTVGKSNGPLDKAAQLHDLQYGYLGPSAYFHHNSADDHFIEDTNKINTNASNLAGAFFKLKKLITTPLQKK